MSLLKHAERSDLTAATRERDELRLLMEHLGIDDFPSHTAAVAMVGLAKQIHQTITTRLDTHTPTEAVELAIKEQFTAEQVKIERAQKLISLQQTANATGLILFSKLEPGNVITVHFQAPGKGSKPVNYDGTHSTFTRPKRSLTVEALKPQAKLFEVIHDSLFTPGASPKGALSPANEIELFAFDRETGEHAFSAFDKNAELGIRQPGALGITTQPEQVVWYAEVDNVPMLTNNFGI